MEALDSKFESFEMQCGIRQQNRKHQETLPKCPINGKQVSSSQMIVSIEPPKQDIHTKALTFHASLRLPM